MDTKLSSNIHQCRKAVESILSGLPSSDIVTFPLYNEGHRDYRQLITSMGNINVTITSDDQDEALVQEVETFNQSWSDRSVEFILDQAFTAVVHQYLQEFIALCKQDDKDDTMITIEQFEIPGKLHDQLMTMTKLLDLVIYLIEENLAFKKIFYKLIGTITNIIFQISTKNLEIFWYYLEHRLEVIKSKVFDGGKDDRISLLILTNSLNDKFFNSYHRHDNLIEKDSFNDTIQARIKIFTNKLLNLGDDTGLNRHGYLTSTRNAPKLLSGKGNKSNKFVSDILLVQGYMKDPYELIKNDHKLKTFAKIASNLFDELIDQEIKYIKSNTFDPFKVTPPPIESQVKYLTDKFNNKIFFPETYFQSEFNDNHDAKALEKELIDDRNLLYDLFNNAIFRQQYLLQIYFTCDFLFELTASNKKTLLSTLPPNSKHFLEESTLDFTAKSFYRIKKEIGNAYRSAGSPISFLLGNLSATERNWWVWLLSGKQSQTLINKQLSPDELSIVDNKLHTLFPDKTDNFFNVFASPQLSKRMRVPQGLHNIKLFINDETNHADTMDLDNGDNDDTQEALQIKQFRDNRSKRSHQWLEFSVDLYSQMDHQSEPLPKQQKT